MSAGTVRASSAATAALLVVALATAYLTGTLAQPRAATAVPTPPVASPVAAATDGQVTVSGTGEVTGTPDVLSVDMSVQVTASSVGDALTQANNALDRVRAVFRRSHVAEADLQTSGLSVQTHTDSAGQVTGYDADESLAVRLRSLRDAGRAIGDAVSAGGSAVRINGVTLDLEGDSQLIPRARQRAFADARAKAGQYADLAHRRLGRLSSVSEQVEGAGGRYPLPSATGAASAVRSTVPIEAGSQQLTVTVSAVWFLQ